MAFEAHDIWAKYEKGKDHHNSVGMYTEAERAHAFYMGDQWRGANTGGEELPVLNFIKPVGKYKISTIAQNLITIVYSPMDTDENAQRVCEMLTKYAASQWELLKMDTIAWEVLKNAFITGDHYAYFYDKTTRTSHDSIYQTHEMKLGVRLVDKTNVYFADEHNPNINEQEWVIISERAPISRIREAAKNNGISDDDIQLILPDNETSDVLGENKAVEVEKDGKCTSLLYMTIKDGQLTFLRAVKNLIYEPEKTVPISIYPLCALRWESRVGDARGLSGVTSMIPNQLEVNKTAARRAIAVKRCAYPSLVYDSSRVRNADALSTVGATIAVDNLAESPINTLFQYLNPAPVSSQAAELQNELMNITQTLEGAGDAALGAVDPTKASGEAIKAARDQAAVPLNEQYAAYRQFIEDVGSLWYELWSAYSAEGLSTMWEENGELGSGFISAAELKAARPRVKIDVSPIDPYSRLSREATLGNLLAAGHITFEEYVNALSDDSGVPKAKLKAILDERAAAAQEQAMMVQGQAMPEAMPVEMMGGGELIGM